MLWRTQTSFLSMIFFCKKKILKLRYDFKNSDKYIIAKIPQICKMHFNKLVISSTVESQLKQIHCKFHKIKNTFFYQHFICISLESQSVINIWLSHNTTYFFIQTSDFCFSYEIIFFFMHIFFPLTSHVLKYVAISNLNN